MGEEIILEIMQEFHVNQVAQIHAHALPEDLLPNLGAGFLEKGYYYPLLNSPYSLVLVALINNTVIGFLNLTFAPDKHLRWVVKKGVIRLFMGLMHLSCHSPRRILEFLIAVLQQVTVPEKSAEIAFIAVESTYHGQGIGKRLVEEANRIAKQKDMQYMFTKTLKSNTHVQYMYKKYWSAQIIQEIQIMNKQYVYLRWKLTDTKSPA
ncbi:MAG: GNAT family N-acetyltransferase [Deltaproteobacteria bacterium]|nr:GNAT family N-acetyltransferase [Deltaproteobacteria bacterium]